MSKEIYVRVDEDGSKITFQSEVLFEIGKYELDPLADAKLEAMIGLLERSEQPVLVCAHTDAVGTRETNLALSLRRARAVARFLVERGLRPQRVTARGRGPDEPLADNRSLDGRARNRRLEIMVGGSVIVENLWRDIGETDSTPSSLRRRTSVGA